MDIRNLAIEDIAKLRHIHSQYFMDEFQFPDFMHGYLQAFAIVNDDNEIVTAGGVRPLMECVLVTDLNKTPRERKQALLLALKASIHSCELLGKNTLHAFVQDELWVQHLEKYGFKPTKGKSLVLGF